MKKILFTALLLTVIGIGMLHFFTPGHLVFYHDTYRRLSYFPIVLGAIWFGWQGGIFMAVLSSIFFIPHLLLYLGGPPETYLSELTEIVLYLAAGTVTGIIASREARLREGYRLLSEKLEKSYARLHRETGLLLEAEEQLSASQRLSALGQLSASLAHEIKNPLSSIRGATEILMDEIPVGHPRREFVEILAKEAARLNVTVEEVLTYSRGRGADPGASMTEPLSHCLTQVNRLVQNHLRKKKVRLTMPDTTAGADFPVDGGRFTQVFLNLILNAIDAVPESGGEIRVELETTADGGRRIAVVDNGPGIPAADREKIFTPFYSGKEDGTGLGLPISRKIVERFGGRLEVTDAETGGACLVVTLPPEANYPQPGAVGLRK